jgi:rhodanese-related sulfurtransferase
MASVSYAGDVTPTEAWRILSEDPRAVLVDVRTPAEWNYVGVPDLSSVGKQTLYLPWIEFPSMQVNAAFGEQVVEACQDPEAPMLFLCRSGVRSRAAAIECTRRGFKACYNVGSGFEGDHDGHRHRGSVNGWKVAGLPWVQA